MRAPEGDAALDQQVGQVGREEEPVGGRRHPGGVEAQVRQHPGHDVERLPERVGRIEERRLVLLEVAVVGERQALQRGEQRHQRARHAPGLAAHQLRHVRVLLLRHHRAAGREGVGQLDEAELLGRPQHELLGKAGEMHGRDRRGGQELDRRVAVRDRVHAVGRDAREAELARDEAPIEGEACARQRAGAERQLVGARAAVAEARPVARQHLVIGEQVVREEDRLRALEVRVAGEERVAMAAGERGERALHSGQGGVDGVALGAQPEAQVERHLIVPAPAGVELPADGADELGEPPLDRHVDVLVGGQEAEAAGVELAAHAREPALEARALAPGEEPRAHQRAHVRHAAGDVVRVEAAVEGQGGREGLGRGGGRRGEASGPRLRRPRPGAAAIHGLLRSTSALMRSRRPESRMNPPASAWR